MRSIKSSLFGCAVAALLGTCAVVGCSASGDTVEGAPTTNSEPEAGLGNTLPPSGPDDDRVTTDAGKKDGGKDAGSDAAKDSGAPPPAPGDACPTVDQKFKKSCGKCGTQEAICRSDKTVSEYGQCAGEIGQCAPGESQSCGNCGTQTCSNTCNWTACAGQPTNSCPPGTVEHSTASCTTPNTYIQRTCDAACTWGSFNSTCESPSLTVAGTVGEVSAGQWTLGSAQMVKRPSGVTCPATSLWFTAVPYFAVPVTNNTGKAAVVQIYHTGTPALDTLLWVYDRATVPTTDDEIKACVGPIADGCDAVDDLCNNNAAGAFSSMMWAGLDDIAIPAGGTIMVYSAGYYATATGNFTLNVKTKTLN